MTHRKTKGPTKLRRSTVGRKTEDASVAQTTSSGSGDDFHGSTEGETPTQNTTNAGEITDSNSNTVHSGEEPVAEPESSGDDATVEPESSGEGAETEPADSSEVATFYSTMLILTSFYFC